METIKIELPVLNKLDIEPQGTLIKLVEEIGELSQVLGKHRGLSGEKQYILEQEQLKNKILEELLDVIQAAISLTVAVQREYNIDIQEGIQNHINKLKQKGYI